MIGKLCQYRERLNDDVIPAYRQRGRAYGRERFTAWRRQLTKYLDEHLPGTSSSLDMKLQHVVSCVLRGESDLDRFMREDGEQCLAFIDSLIKDIADGEFDSRAPTRTHVEMTHDATDSRDTRRVFIVHGHDDKLKTQAARFIEKLGFEAIILHEQASKGMTIIEKIEATTNVGFAIVLYTADDAGNTAAEASEGQLRARARQNVIFEHGYLIAKLGRAKVVPLIADGIELPSDVSGMVYVGDTNWQFDIAKEMKAAGYPVDFNLLFPTEA